MALELLAGPYTVTNKLTGSPISRSISGSPTWIDGRGLALSGYLVQMDGAAYPVTSQAASYGLAEIGAKRWHGMQVSSFGNEGEWDIDAVTLFKAAKIASDYVSLGDGYARLADRYIYPMGGFIFWRPLNLSASGVSEATLVGFANGVSLSWGSLRDEVVVGSSDGKAARYDVVAKSLVGSIQTIGMTCKGLWWSALHGVYLSLHDNGSVLELRVWAATVQPASVSNPTPDTTITAGRRTRVRSRVLGAHSDPCEGEVVAWTLTGVGALSSAASYTDAAGYAETYYEAPLGGAAASITITAEVAI